MIKKQYSGNARRARNIIWNAAGRYDFEPPFMAFFPNGTPDHYFNMVAGLVEKWLDMKRLWDFFASYETSRRADEFADPGIPPQREGPSFFSGTEFPLAPADGIPEHAGL